MAVQHVLHFKGCTAWEKKVVSKRTSMKLTTVQNQDKGLWSSSVIPRSPEGLQGTPVSDQCCRMQIVQQESRLPSPFQTLSAGQKSADTHVLDSLVPQTLMCWTKWSHINLCTRLTGPTNTHTLEHWSYKHLLLQMRLQMWSNWSFTPWRNSDAENT